MNICSRIYKASILLALVLFLGGNVLYQGTVGGRKIFIEASDWSIALIPAFLVLFFCSPSIWRNTFPTICVRKVWSALLKKRAQATVILSLVVIPLLLLTWRAVVHRYLSFESGWDLGIYSQACANGLYSSLREERTLLADHFEPILAMFVPWCQRVDAPLVLLTAQILALGVGVAGIAKLALSLRWSMPSTLVLAVLYVVFSGQRITFFYDFHPITFSAATLPWLVISLRSGRYLWTGVLVLITFSLKETSALTVAGVGLWWSMNHTCFAPFRFAKKNFFIGLLIAAFGFATFFLIMKVAFPYFRGGAESLYFTKYYGHLGHSMGEVVGSILFKPLLVADTVFNREKMIYLLKVFGPFIFAGFFRPHFLIPVIPALMVNLLTSHPYLFSARFHYEADVYPWLFIVSVLLSRDPIFLRRWQKVLSKIPLKHLPMHLSYRSVWMVVMLCFFGGKSLAWYNSAYPISNQQLVIRNYLLAERAEWSELRVAVFEPLAPHLTNVRHLFLLERWQDADLVVIGYPAGKGSWIHSIEQIEDHIIPALAKEFELAYQDKIYPTFRVWKRKPHRVN